MNTKLLLISCGMLVLSSACNNASESKTATTDSAKPMATDTVAAVAPAEPPAPVIDSAAITKEYLAARRTPKKASPKKQGANTVEISSDAPMPTQEALEQPKPT